MNDAPRIRRSLVPSFDRLVFPPAEAIPDDAPQSLDLLALPLDDATTGYVLATHAPFDLLRQAISQFAGVMVLAAAGARNDCAPDLIDRLRDQRAEADDLIRGSANSAPARATHHHRHLSRACAALGAALNAAQTKRGLGGSDALEAIMTPLNAAYRELQWATGALPGFEVVALSQGCCGAHAGLQKPTHKKRD